MLPREQQSSSYISDDIYSAVILEEAERLYNELTTKLTNEVLVASTVYVSASSLPSQSNNNNQRLIHKIDNIHQTEIYSNVQE